MRDRTLLLRFDDVVKMLDWPLIDNIRTRSWLLFTKYISYRRDRHLEAKLTYTNNWV